MNTNSTNMPGIDGFAGHELLLHQPWTFAEHVNIEEDWDAFNQEWSHFIAADFEADTQQSNFGTAPADTLANQQVDDHLRGWDWDMFSPLGDPGSINFPEYITSLQSSTAMSETPQLFPPSPFDSPPFASLWTSTSSSSPNTMAGTFSSAISEPQLQSPSSSDSSHLPSSSPSSSSFSPNIMSHGVPKQASSPQNAPHSCSKTFIKRHDLK